jgi:hypothetical protein
VILGNLYDRLNYSAFIAAYQTSMKRFFLLISELSEDMIVIISLKPFQINFSLFFENLKII